MKVFAYDPIGNRVSATDYDETGAAHTSLYAANALNQYVSRTVPGWASVRGLAHSNAYVTVNGSAAFRLGEYYFGSDQFDNSLQAGFAELETVAVLNGATNDLVSVETNTAFIAAATETFTYDDDGNLTEDGHFRYLWNGENRMIRAEEKVSPPDRSAYVITYAYDHIGRNVMKDGARYIWDGYNIIVENAGTANATYNTWGLDLDGTLQGVGGVGGLLAVVRAGESSIPAYDGNGNITEYIDCYGSIVSHNDYSSFGREMMASGMQGHVHRFSTKPTCRRSGLVEYQMRKYMPWYGRWGSRDPIEEEGGLSLYLHLRNYPFDVDVIGCASLWDWVMSVFVAPSAPGGTSEVSSGLESWGMAKLVAKLKELKTRAALLSAEYGSCPNPDLLKQIEELERQAAKIQRAINNISVKNNSNKPASPSKKRK